MTTDDRGCGMTWDFDNMLQNFAANGVTDLRNASYEYDAIGRRVAKTLAPSGPSPATTLFVQAGRQTVCEYTSGNAAANSDRKYIFGTFTDEVLKFVDAAATSEPRFWLHQNRQYSVYSMTAAEGLPVEFYSYALHGKHESISPTGSPRGASLTGHHGITFTGRQFLEESFLLSFRARLFATSCGRFLTRDRFQYADGASMYTGYFVPSGTDATGLLCTDCEPGKSKNVRATGITFTNDRIVGDPENHDSLGLTEKELQIWLQVLSIFESVKGAKTKVEILEELLLEKYGPTGYGDIDTDKITKAFDDITDIIDLGNAFSVRVWITLTGECCREGKIFSNSWESHTFHEPCSTILPNPNRKGIDPVQQVHDKREYDEFIGGGGLRRCKESALKAFDCSKSSNKKQLNDPDDKLIIK